MEFSRRICSLFYCGSSLLWILVPWRIVSRRIVRRILYGRVHAPDERRFQFLVLRRFHNRIADAGARRGILFAKHARKPEVSIGRTRDYARAPILQSIGGNGEVRNQPVGPVDPNVLIQRDVRPLSKIFRAREPALQKRPLEGIAVYLRSFDCAA
jgi:hypothetical protein